MHNYNSNFTPGFMDISVNPLIAEMMGKMMDKMMVHVCVLKEAFNADKRSSFGIHAPLAFTVIAPPSGN